MLSERARGEIEEEIHTKLKDAISGSWKIYYSPNIPRKVLEAAMCHFLCWEDEENIFAVVDTTIFGACDEGLVFTDEGLHYKDGYDEPEFFSTWQ